MHRYWFHAGLLAAHLFDSPILFAQSESLDEIVVTAGLRSSSVAEMPQSITVLDGETQRSAGVQHFEDVLSLIPDLN